MFTMEMNVLEKPMIVILGICTSCFKFWNHIASCMFIIFHKRHERTYYRPQWHPNAGQQYKLQCTYQWKFSNLDINEDNNSNSNSNENNNSNANSNGNPNFNANISENPMHTRPYISKSINKGFGNVGNGGTRNIVSTKIKLN